MSLLTFPHIIPFALLLHQIYKNSRKKNLKWKGIEVFFIYRAIL